jgi:hypothetical protein
VGEVHGGSGDGPPAGVVLNAKQPRVPALSCPGVTASESGRSAGEVIAGFTGAAGGARTVCATLVWVVVPAWFTAVTSQA